MTTSAKIAELQSKVTALETSLAAAEGKSTTLEAQLNQAKLDLATAQTEAGKVAGLTAEITQLKADLQAANDKATKAEADLTQAKADFEAKVDGEVTTRLAAAGVDPIKRDPKAKTEDPGSTQQGLTGRQLMAAAFGKQFKK